MKKYEAAGASFDMEAAETLIDEMAELLNKAQDNGYPQFLVLTIITYFSAMYRDRLLESNPGVTPEELSHNMFRLIDEMTKQEMLPDLIEDKTYTVRKEKMQ